MKMWLQRIWSWFTANRSADRELDDQEEREFRQQEEQLRLEQEQRNRRRESDGFRFVR